MQHFLQHKVQQKQHKAHNLIGLSSPGRLLTFFVILLSSDQHLIGRSHMFISPQEKCHIISLPGLFHYLWQEEEHANKVPVKTVSQFHELAQ